jgi:polysaccharide pyruvyl transferase WcaK-like protein
MKNIYCIRPKGFNIGNNAINIAMINFLREAVDDGINIIGLPATSRWESSTKAGLTPQTVYEINQFGDGVIIGGGNLYENNELDINPVALKALDVPLMLFSMSRGQIYNKRIELTDRTDVMPDEKIRMLNERADFSLSRDIATFEYINGLGIDNVLGGCPTLFLNEIPQHMVPISSDLHTDALISVRNPSLMSIPMEYQFAMKSQVEEIIGVLRSRGYQNIKLLCHDHRDIPFAAIFKDVDYIYTDDVYTFLTYLKNTKLNVTYRLHSFLPGISLDIPVVKLSYDQRAISLLETVGLDDWNINILKHDVISEVKNRIDNLNELEILKSELKKEKWIERRNIITDNFRNFASLL